LIDDKGLFEESQTLFFFINTFRWSINIIDTP